MSGEDQLGEYRVGLKLASGASLEMLMFSHAEHRWIFKHRYVYPERGKRLGRPALTNDTRLVVDYEAGLVQGINLTMDIIRPNRRGKKYFMGVDISEDSRLFIEFLYEKQGDLYRMKTVNLGMHKQVNLDSLGKGLVKPVDFPFPLKDCVEDEFGVYKVPFLRNDGRTSFFEYVKCLNPEDTSFKDSVDNNLQSSYFSLGE